MPNHFTLTFFLLRRRDVSCSHSNRDLFTCEDIMFSRESSPGISFSIYIINACMAHSINTRAEVTNAYENAVGKVGNGNT